MIPLLIAGYFIVYLTLNISLRYFCNRYLIKNETILFINEDKNFLCWLWIIIPILGLGWLFEYLASKVKEMLYTMPRLNISLSYFDKLGEKHKELAKLKASQKSESPLLNEVQSNYRAFKIKE